MVNEDNNYDDRLDAPWHYDAEQFGRQLGHLRERYPYAVDDAGRLLCWTPAELAEKAGCTKQYIGQLLRGQVPNPSVERLTAIINAFDGDVPMGYFFSERVRQRTDRRLDARVRELRAEQASRSRHQQPYGSRAQDGR